MTVTYTKDLPNASWFAFFSLLLKWRGGFYKLVLPQGVVFFCVYFFLMALYVFVLCEESRRVFENIVSMFSSYRNSICSAVALFLGFFINQIFRRFWAQFLAIPWPDSFSYLVSVNLIGQDSRSRLMRRTLVRYVSTAVIMGLCDVAPKVRKRFPNAHSYVAASLLTPNEANIIDGINSGIFNKYHLLLSWSCALLRRARKAGKIQDEHGYNSMFVELDKVRGQLGALSMYGWVPVPLVYVHVVVLAVYAFFSVVVIAHPFEQWQFSTGQVFSVEDGDSNESDINRETRLRMRLLFTMITLIQFCVFAGMLHTSEALLVPFGYGDNSIDVDQLVDRHLRMSYLIVDEMYYMIPELMSDSYWSVPLDEIALPYTVGARLSRTASEFHRGISVISRGKSPY